MKKTRLTRFIQLVGIALFYTAIFLYSVIFNNPTGWTFFFFLTFLLLCDLLTLMPTLKTLSLHLTERTTYEVNQSSPLKLEIYRSKPTIVRIPVLSVLLNETAVSNVYDLSFYSGQKTRLLFNWKPAKRGIYQELSFKLVSSDLVGFLKKQKTVALAGPFVVLPALQAAKAELIYQELLKHDPTFVTLFGQQTFAIRNFRGYRTGDSFSSVDWKQSGKRNELIVKEYEQETESSPHLLFYGIADEQFEELLSLYYSFTFLLETKSTFQQTILADYPSSSSKEQLFATAAPLTEQPILPNVTHKKIVIFAPSTSSKLRAQLQSLQQTNDVFLITLTDGELAIYRPDQVGSKGGASFE